MANISKIKLPGSNTAYDIKDTVSGYVATEATTSAKGLMSSADKTKLNGIASGAEVNQNAFSNVVVGTTTVAADSKTDSLTLEGGANITLTPDATNDKITISLDDTVDTGEVIATDVQAGNLIVNGTSRFLNTINGDISGNSANVTGTVAIANGGTGATTIANARSNLQVPTMTTDTYPTLLPTNGVNNWIKIGTSNSSYGLLPSVAGNSGSGHNYIGTSTWYWKYAYIDEIHGTLIGNADTATKLGSSNVGSATQPIYLSGGTATACTYTLGKSVPSDAVFTDHYAWTDITSKPTTLSGYGITDAKIASGTITLGSNTITPLTSSSTLNAAKLSGTIPSGCYTDTKNTAGSTDTSSKIYLVGAASQGANPQTYSDDEVYVTSGVLTTKSVQVGGGSATIQYNSTTQSLDFVFAS